MSGARIEVVSRAAVNLRVTTVVGAGGGGVTDHGALTGLADDDHLQYQRADATFVTTDTHDIDNESLTITSGSMIAMPPAESMASRVVAIGASVQDVTIEAVAGDIFFDDPGNDYVLPAGNGIGMVALEIDGQWGWAIEFRNGPAFDMPRWYGQGFADGDTLTIDNGIPTWVTPTGGSGTVTSVTGTAPISVDTGTTTPVVSIAAATTSAAGSMSSTDKAKLDGVASGATANSSDATLLARANHTGTQTLSTISDAGTAAAKNTPASGNASSTQVVLGSDTRLTDSRTPSTHASSHGATGSDPVTLAQSQVTNLTTDLAGKVGTSDSRLTDTRTPTDGSVSTAKLADSAVTSAKIADGTIVNADISTSAAIATSKISGLATIATSGSASDLSTGTVPSARLSLTASDIPNHDASKITSGTLGVARLATQAQPTASPYASNDWVPLWTGWGVGTTTQANAGTTTSASNRVGYQPIWIGQSVSLIGLGIDVSAANAGASAVVRLGLYADNAGRPGTVTVDAGTASLNTAVAKELTFTSVSLSPGWYWLALATQNLDTAGTNPTFRAVATNTSIATRTAVPSATSSQYSRWESSSVSGAFAANPTVTSSTTSANAFLIWGKFA